MLDVNSYFNVTLLFVYCSIYKTCILSNKKYNNQKSLLQYIFSHTLFIKKERQDITGSNCLKGVSGNVIVDEKGIRLTEGAHLRCTKDINY